MAATTTTGNGGTAVANRKTDREAKKQSPWDNPEFSRRTLASLIERAGRGDKDAAANLERVFSTRPELRPAVPELEDLGTRAENAWVSAAANGDAVRV
jgi:hypothetical protein